MDLDKHRDNPAVGVEAPESRHRVEDVPEDPGVGEHDDPVDGLGGQPGGSDRIEHLGTQRREARR